MSAQELITKHLDVWTSAHKTRSIAGRGSNNKLNLHGIKKLRELILELAVRGKLVPQDSNDEPAIALINRISIEIDTLIKERKIKKTHISTSIPLNKIPYELPHGWEWVTLSQIGNIFSGNSINSNIKENKYTGLELGLPFIATKDVGYGWEEIDYENGVKIPYGEPKFLVAPAHSVLICAEGGSAGKKCGVTTKDICFGNKLFANTLYGSIPSRFILANYLSPSFYQRFSSEMTGIIGGIGLASFSQLLVPLPPLAEQHRIVAKVDELMAFCDQLEQTQSDNIADHAQLVEALLAILIDSSDHFELQNNWQRIAAHFDTLFTTEHSIDQLKQTILQLAVMGKLVPQNPNDEPASELLKKIAAEKVQLIKEGKIKKEKPLPEIMDEEKPFGLPSGWEWVRVGQFINLVSGQHLNPNEYSDVYVNGMLPYLTGPADFGDIFPEASRFTSETRALAREGDILITCKGSGVGKLNRANKTAAISRQLMAIQNIGVCAEYLFLIMDSLNAQIRLKIVGIAIPGISREDITYAVTMLPPVSEQHRIVAKVDELMSLCDTLKTNLQNAQTTQLALADALVEQAVN